MLAQKRIGQRGFAGIPITRDHQRNLSIGHSVKGAADHIEQLFALGLDPRLREAERLQAPLGIRQTSNMHVVTEREVGVSLIRPHLEEPVDPVITHRSNDLSEQVIQPSGDVSEATLLVARRGDACLQGREIGFGDQAIQGLALTRDTFFGLLPG